MVNFFVSMRCNGDEKESLALFINSFIKSLSMNTNTNVNINNDALLSTGFDVVPSDINSPINHLNKPLKFSYPIHFKFRISTVHNDFVATDSHNNCLAYVKQKIFALKAAVKVFSDTEQNNLIYEIQADKWLAFNICHTFSNAQGVVMGKVLRQGMRSLWKASYEIHDASNTPVFIIKEANPWIKVFDAVLSEIPFLGFLMGYVLNPKYTLSRPDGALVFVCSKEPSLFGRKFKINALSRVSNDEEEIALLGSMMMLLIERHRG
jgi:hypothetical protein